MKTKISRKSFLQFLLSTLIMYTILFPADKLNIKEILLVITLFFGYFGKRIQASSKIIAFGFAFPLITIIYALLRGVDFSGALSFGYAWLFLLLIPLIKEYEFNLKKIFIIATYIVALIIDFIMIMDLLNLMSIGQNFMAKFFMNMNEIQGLGKGELSTFGYSIFYKPCPLIIITYAYLIFNKKIVKSIPLLIALFACGTRANFLIAIAITVLIPIFCFKKENKKFFIILTIILLSFYFIPIVYNKMSDLNAIKQSNSEAIKLADSKIVINSLKDNTLDLFLGTGVGSAFLSVRGHYMQTFELSFIDYLRQVGIVGLMLFFIFIGLIVKKLLKNKEIWLLIALLGFIAVAFTNPLLVTSTSFMVYLLAICYNDKEFGGFKDERGITFIHNME